LKSLLLRVYAPRKVDDFEMNDFAEKTSPADVKILVVEDHDELRSSLVDWMKGILVDFSFLAARSGEEAVQIVSQQRRDIVIMDIQLPEMNGIEAVRRIKKINPQTQTVILSIYNDHAYREEAMKAGACAYINKHNMHLELIPVLIRLLPAKVVSHFNLQL
jgi:CheY-like chemotaxis protein